MQLDSVVIVGGARTAIGGFGGALSSFAPHELGTLTAIEALRRVGVEGNDIDHSVYGHIITTGPEDAYLARHIALNAGVPKEAGAFNVNRLCGSGVQAVVSAAQQIALGDSRLALAGGAETMSRGAYVLAPQARNGIRMGDCSIQDLTLGVLSDPFGSGHMGITAENIAQQYGLSREQLDQFALDSHQKAARAISEGRFDTQIVPVEVTKGKQTLTFARDEHVREGVELGDLARLKPAFKRDGVVTAGNASGINDGAATLVLAHAEEAQARGLTVRARLRVATTAGVEPSLMGLGPIPAVKRCLQQAGLTINDIDVIESNEAFAAQAMAVASTLGFPLEKLNPNGG
ncbi:MAG: acetyl-CoA C-acyltransferase, partial [Pseudomonadota bacterium]|nr:acetyl-CoA C-acyltransferase [Pseudomonadota bacterium]